MKNTILLTGFSLFLATALVSCKKEYTCQCTKTYSSSSGSTTNNYSVYTYNDNRKRAEDRCNANEATGTDLYGNYSINCSIQ